jgi:NADP-dependent 3-hydroxy acid dehydrogenase YdfG
MIVITGASEGLGLSLAKLYKDSGKKVVNISRKECEYADVNICLSLREGQEIEQAAKQVAELDDTLEAVIHNAGVASIQPFGEIEETEIKRLMSTNVKSQILLTSYLIDRIRKDGTDIMCVSSTLGTKGRKDWSVYTASKWAVRGLAQSLQDEFSDSPNRVISFVPGGMASKNVENFNGEKLTDPEDWMQTDDMALFMKQILDLPKNMEVSEVIVNRKSVR